MQKQRKDAIACQNAHKHGQGHVKYPKRLDPARLPIGFARQLQTKILLIVFRTVKLLFRGFFVNASSTIPSLGILKGLVDLVSEARTKHEAKEAQDESNIVKVINGGEDGFTEAAKCSKDDESIIRHAATAHFFFLIFL